MNREYASLEALSGLHLAQVGIVQQSVFVEFVFHVSEREFGSPDWHVEFRENPRQGTDVIFMAVREHDPTDMLPVFGEVRNVGDHDIDAEKFGLGEHEAAVDDKNVVSPADRHAVHTELAEASEGDDL